MLRLKGKLLVYTFKAILTLIVVLVPLLGVWFSSSLTAYWNGPIWLALLSGLFFFPGLPLLWDWWATVRWKRKQQEEGEVELDPKAAVVAEQRKSRGRILVFWDRLILRTLVVNLALLVTLGWLFPDEGFTALSARGDWMLDNVDGEWSEPVSDALFATAGAVEFLYYMAHENPYEQYADDDTVAPEIEDRGDLRDRSGDVDDEPDSDDPDAERPAMSWPPPDDLHPVVAEMPESAETSIQSVAAYIAEREDDPFYRVKALFDYVADRLTYDVAVLEALEQGRHDYPPQDAEAVFEAGTAVCAGYARLLVELGRETGDEIVYVTGVSREQDGSISGLGHAWNAARIEGQWYLMDPTWGSGSVDSDEGFKARYNPTYLFTPPRIFINTHYPDDEGWQLLEEPLSRGEFVRQPQLRPTFFANGMELIEPTRSQTSVGSEARIVLGNPKGRYIRGFLAPLRGGEGEECDVSRGDETVVRCPIPASGRYQVMLFGGSQRYGTMPMWGKIEVQGG